MEVFKKGIEPADVCQGRLGDCYFLSVISALAEEPGRIESLFNTQEVNAAGIYSLNFFLNGKRQEVFVDDFVPCDRQSLLPCFAYSEQCGEIWAILLEKAWAKLHGSYCMVRSGSSVSTFPHLCGAPSSQFDHNYQEDLEKFWAILKDASERKYSIASSTYDTDVNQSGPKDAKRGIVSGHSYSVLSCHQFKHQGEKVKLLKLRNPHGNYEWKGDWSDECPKWTTKLRKDLGSVNCNTDGLFFIPFADFVQNFRCTSICYMTTTDR